MVYLSNLRNGHDPCHYFFGPHVAVSKVHVALSNLRNSQVALSILGVKGHNVVEHSFSWDKLLICIARRGTVGK